MGKSPYDEFPYIATEELILRKMEPSDVGGLFDIYGNPNLFRHSINMHRKNRETVANMIGHFQRDFGKKKWILLGITLRSRPDFVVGVAEMFDYDPQVGMVTIGYRVNEAYWGQGIATKTVAAMVEYLFQEIGLQRIQAFVMPDNEKSLNVLRRNHFVEEGTIRRGHYWKGQGLVDLTLFSLLRTEYKG